MPYQQWTRCDCGDISDGPHYAEQGGIKFWWADERAREKWLTHAECAAEYWKAATALYALGTYHAELARKRETLERFALTPHALENGDDQ